MFSFKKSGVYFLDTYLGVCTCIDIGYRYKTNTSENLDYLGFIGAVSQIQV
jgi:hypothetical protein